MSARLFALTSAALLCAALTAPSADAGGPRQYYGPWQRHSTHGYQFRSLYFKPTPKFGGYKHHYVIHHPQRPQHHYFYNPYKKAYWGRCPSTYGDEPKYSMLPEEHRKGSLKDIPESAFPEPGPLPPLPETTDGEPLDLPPDDLPADSLGLPSAAE